MLGHATVLNLLPLSDTDESVLCSRLGVDGVTLVTGAELRNRGVRGGLNYLRKTHSKAGSGVFAIHSHDWARQTQRTSLYGLACLVRAKRRLVVDQEGNVIPLSWRGFVFKELPGSIAQKIAGRSLLSDTLAMMRKNLDRKPVHRIAPPGSVDNILYLRTDLWLGVKAGGSIGHVAGVIDGFKRNGIGTTVMSWEKPALTGTDVGFQKVPPDNYFVNEREPSLLAYNGELISAVAKWKYKTKPQAVYARYSLDCWAPVSIAEMLKVPLILEYNGSEVWVEDKWGRGLKYRQVAEKIEEWVLKSSEMITVVSRPLKDELVKRGIEARRILINPNAVDPERFYPDRYSDKELTDLRNRLGIPEGTTIAGFIGTFSPWHGVEVLAQAIPLALKNCSRLHFLLIGTGPLFDKVKDRLRIADVLDRITFTGLVEQDEAPKYLMLSDFFLSPHVPNPDGTPFFGSPTKLFEYMALEKGIIASDLDQLGEILTHEETAILVKPADSKILALAISRLYDNPDLSGRLGKAAHDLVLKDHTWTAHVEKILHHLYQM